MQELSVHSSPSSLFHATVHVAKKNFIEDLISAETRQYFYAEERGSRCLRYPVTTDPTERFSYVMDLKNPEDSATLIYDRWRSAITHSQA